MGGILFTGPPSTILNFKPKVSYSNKIPPTTELDREVGSASRGSGGRDNSSSSNNPFNRWVPPSVLKRDAFPQDHDPIFRKVRGILNKLTPEKFDKLTDAILRIGLDSSLILKGVILLIFDKALDEPKYSFLYAQLCKRLSESAPNFDPPDAPCTFVRLLLNKCKDEFDNRSHANQVFDDRDGPLSASDEEQRQLAKQKMLGNIRFICELGKMGMLHEAVLHSCIQQLLAKKRHQQLRDLSEDVECACQIMRTCGARLDTERARPLMDQYFRRMDQLAEQPELPNRIRFMLQNTAELRAHNWQVRAVNRPDGPRTISSIRQEARAAGVLPPGRAAPPSRSFPALPMMAPGGGRQRGMEDVFGSLPVGFSTLGTGPGVIGLDGRSNGRQPAHAMLPGRGGAGGGRFPPQQAGYGGKHGAQPQGFGNGGAKDLPPRFKRMIVNPSGPEDLSLRPAANSMVLKPQAPSMVPKNLSVGTRPISMTKNEAPPIIKASHDKPRAKARAAGREEVVGSALALLHELWAGGALDAAATAWRDCKVPDSLTSHVVQQMLARGMQRSEEERVQLVELLTAVHKADTLPPHHSADAFHQFIDGLEDDLDVKEQAAGGLAAAVRADLLELGDVAAQCEGGAHFPLFFIVLQRLSEQMDNQQLMALCTKTKTSLLTQLPAAERTKERLAEVLDERQLAFLCPLLPLPAQLVRQLAADPSEAAFYKWIRANVPAALHQERDFVGALFSSVIRFITEQTTLAADVDRTQMPDKALQERERELLQRFRQVLQAFTHEHVQLQVTATYALQVYCYQHQFPKGMLLRWFNLLYDLEIVEEEAFLRWKEDVNDEYPGKGKALFQVNQWLTWLEEAESDEGDEDDD
ncbi:eukaryotic translation initiation factor 4 gamma 2-like [Pollicipes pollicipes]|uniref:eukaryotic translation initiation factor 4 gamma 2-like n=1 Tax=Pollicipes pollicipes TaxID=41117 RepID=UPI0018850849|nr:eukaryotic translation initiation factor 4 gamma 2-like [Pollicipes pollicipes]